MRKNSKSQLQSSTPWTSYQKGHSTRRTGRQRKMQNNEKIRSQICQSCRDKAGARSFLTKAATPCFRTFISVSFFFFFLDILALKINGAQAVQDPEPKLLDSNFVELSKQQLLFRPSRKYTASMHFIHIRVPFNFSQLALTPTLTHLQPVPPIHQKMARTFLHTG